MAQECMNLLYFMGSTISQLSFNTEYLIKRLNITVKRLEIAFHKDRHRKKKIIIMLNPTFFSMEQLDFLGKILKEVRYAGATNQKWRVS